LLDIRIETARTAPQALVVAVRAGGEVLLAETDPLRDELEPFLAEVDHSGSPGSVECLPRPGRRPRLVILVGVGAADEAGWRAAGAESVRAASARTGALAVAMPEVGEDAAPVAGFAEGAWLASYRFGSGAKPPPVLRRVSIATDDPNGAAAALERTRVVAEATVLARDLTNTPSLVKSPNWFATRITRAAAGRPGVTVKVLDEEALAAGGFGGILAVGSGSSRPPRLVELSWRPRGATRHVVLVGKGITFDSGGINLKPLESMRLMRKDMAGAAAVCAALLGAARLRAPVRVTALAPLAENMVSGSAYRPGDVVRHYGGLTTEVQNTDAEGRVVLGDALAYAARRLRPDRLVDLATLTGAQNVALGKRTAALYTHDDELATELGAAAGAAGERMWRMPLLEDYRPLLHSDIADQTNAPAPGNAGSVLAALFLREFTGGLRDHWAHIDMSSPSWADGPDRELVKGATGWGVRTLVRWLTDG
jgi:leucyl aminopeptidase